MAATNLPSSEAASKALNDVNDNCEGWRDIVTLSIQYATKSSALGMDMGMDVDGSTNNAAKDDDANHGRVKQTVTYLLEALNRLSNDDSTTSTLTTTQQQTADVEMEDVEHNHKDATTRNAQRRDMAENILVDALWLSGTMLEPTTTTTPKGIEQDKSENDTAATKEAKAYAALCQLTYDLAQAQPSPTKQTAANAKAQPPPLTPIPRRKLLTALEPRHLNASKILSDQFLQLFIKKIRKLNTDMYYRQKKVNLMQEESEGYAKLLRFLVNVPQVEDMDSIAADADGNESRNGGMDAQSTHCINNIVQLAKLRITELIGTFDLDPNRCLDLTLDALEGEIRQTLSKQRQERGDVNLHQLVRNAPGSAITVHVLLHLIQLFPVDNVTHLIGFKFAAYAKKYEGDTPQSLYLTTVILASHQLLSLAALNPHLPPLAKIDDIYVKWKQKYQQRIKKLGVVSLNSSNKKTDTSEDDDLMETFGESNQSIQLFVTMLDVGMEWDFAREIFNAGGGDEGAMTDYTVKCCCLSATLGSTLCDILHQAIDPIYTAKAANVGSSLCISEKEEEGELALLGNAEYALLPKIVCEKKVLQLSVDLTLEKMLESISSIMEPIIVSGSIASHAVLYTKLCRLVRSMLLTLNSNEKPIQKVDDKVLEFMDRVLISSLSLFPFNPAIASELWAVLSLVSYPIRYALYASWRKHGLEKAALRSMVQPPKPLAQVESEVNTGISTKYLLKRMSKDNIKDMGRQVSKVAHNNPLVVFTLMLNQIESYDNLILMMVDTFKFMGVLSLDVMGYCLLVSLGGEGEGRNKLKDDGVNAAQWLSSLETFTGAFYKRFTDVEVHGLLAYFMRRLNEGHILELGVLQSLLKMTGGYGFVDSGASSSLSSVQLEGRCGSLVLRKQTSDFGIVESVNVHASSRLRFSLQDDNCGVTFLILLFQLRAKIVYDESNKRPKQIKLIGNLYDNCQRTLNTLLPFLTDGSQDNIDGPNKNRTGAISEYAKALPTLLELHTKFGVATTDAWALCRPLVRAALFAEKDLSGDNLLSFHPTSDSMEDSYFDLLPEDSWNHITPILFHRFNSYAIYDLHCPEERYGNEITRIKRETDRLILLQKGGRDAIGIQASMASAVAAAGGTERAIRNATAFTREHKMELDRHTDTTEMLLIDMKRQKKHAEEVHKLLKSEKNDFFADLSGEKGSLDSASVFLTTCVYQRILLSPEDAMYCSRFITLLHSMDTPGFYTLEFLDKTISAVVGALYSITENEAGCLGIFLSEQWSIISDWRYDEKSYEAKLSGKDGGKTKEGLQSISHSEYIELYNKWHAGLGAAFIGCLKSSEYMHTRTALIILSRMVDFFPTKSTLGERLLEALAPLQQDSNPMQDIKAMAQGYTSKIIIARDTGRWKEECSKITKAREEKEKKMQQDRKENAKKQLEAMEKEMAGSAKQTTESRPDRNHNDRRGPARFTPAHKQTNDTNSNGDKNGRPQDSRNNKEQNAPRRNEPRTGDRNSGLQERWERNGPDGRAVKRTRSPERGASERTRPSDRDRGRRKDSPPPHRTRPRPRR